MAPHVTYRAAHAASTTVRRAGTDSLEVPASESRVQKSIRTKDYERIRADFTSRSAPETAGRGAVVCLDPEATAPLGSTASVVTPEQLLKRLTALTGPFSPDTYWLRSRQNDAFAFDVVVSICVFGPFTCLADTARL